MSFGLMDVQKISIPMNKKILKEDSDQDSINVKDISMESDESLK